MLISPLIISGEISKKIDPQIIFSIHSYTKEYEKNIREGEIGILPSHSEALADFVIKKKL